MSDRAKALVNLATVVHKVTSIADCFHFKYCINHLLCLALSSKLRCAKADFSNASGDRSPGQLIRATDRYAQIQFYTDLYVESMRNISHCIHPFFNGNKNNTSQRAEKHINIELDNISQIVEDCQINDKYNLFTKAQQQVPDVVAVIDKWQHIKKRGLGQMKLPGPLSQWFEEYLLPKTYWETMLKRTKHKPMQNTYKNELSIIEKYNNYEQQILCIPKGIIEHLQQKAAEICRKFQRASSQVEGRNGYLSAINHNQRSFDSQRLEVLTVVHNFDTKGVDGMVPAERLFGKYVKFDQLFEFIIDDFGELPSNRNKKPTG